MRLEKIKNSFLMLKQLALSELIFMLLVGVFFGIVGQIIRRPIIGIVCGTLIITLFAIYTLILKTNEGVWSGLFAGILIGIASVGISMILGGSTDSFGDSFLFSLIRGLIFGAIAGALTHAQPEEEDSLITKLFLFFGSILLVSLLGGGVGLIVGVVLGLINSSPWWWVITAVLGGTVGAYLASVKQKPLIILIVFLLSAAISVVVIWQNSVLAGVFVGLLSGAIAPMLMVSSISAVGGLTARGPIAMVIEAIEAPQDMLRQGAVPFLVPAMLLGLIIGTITSDIVSLLVLPTTLGLCGIFLGALEELERKPLKHINSRTFIDKIIIGADKWPIKKTAAFVFQPQHRQQLFVGIILSIIAGIGSGYAGIFIISGIIEYIQNSGVL